MKFSIFSSQKKEKNYKLIKSKTFKAKNDFLKSIYDEWDSVGSISLELGNYLEEVKTK